MFTKTLRGLYFRQNRYIKDWRNYIGPEKFDMMYKQVFTFLSKLVPGQYFYVRNLCRKNPDNHFLFLIMIDIYYNMDYFVSLTYDYDTDKITINPPNLFKGMKPPYHPRDMYSEIIKDPLKWNIDPTSILNDNEIKNNGLTD